MTTVISVEQLSKSYRLGQIGTGTFTYDLALWWAKLRGKPNPLLRIGETDHGNRDGGTLWALKEVSFTVQQGEVLGIIGRNGAGKSTLLKILSRVTAPTSGRIRVKGRIASLLEVGTGFHPDLTGRENIYLNGAILGMSRQEVTRKFDEIVDFAEVEKFIDTPVKRYSSGMYVRLAFAVAAHLEPEILVVDEVLAVGDAEFQKKCLGKMGAVAEEGRTVLFVSHNMGAITQLCPRSLLLERGFIKEIGLSSQIIKSYLGQTLDNTSQASLTERVDDRDFCLTEFAVYQDGECKSHYHSDKPIEVVLTYRIVRPLKNLLLGFDFINSEGFIIFRAYDLECIGLGTRSEGTYRSIFTIPANVLKSGDYFFDFLAAIHRLRWISRNQLRFSMNVIGTKANDVDFLGIINSPNTWIVESMTIQTEQN